MSTIDNRVVKMTFDNKEFEKEITKSQTSLNKLDSSISNIDGKGFTSVENSLKKLNGSFNTSSKTTSKYSASANTALTSIATGVSEITSRFEALGVIGTTALATVSSMLTQKLLGAIKKFTFGPIIGGFQEYETQMNAIQTIMANTSSKGTTLKEVNEALDELNVYADKTIYNFSEMTKNIGTFTAAGVDLKTSVSSIQGIANLAAVSGSNSQQAATAMYQLSQAIASGTVKLQDWNSVVNAGMGGQKFQDALKSTARFHGVQVDKLIKDAGSFRESLKQGWITAEILNETLAKMTSKGVTDWLLSISNASDKEKEALRKSTLALFEHDEAWHGVMIEGTGTDLAGNFKRQAIELAKYTNLSADQIYYYLKEAKMAEEAATKVKTFSQLMSTVDEALGSGWATTWRYIIGDFEQARGFFTDISKELSAFIDMTADARNNVLKIWSAASAEEGGREALVDAINNIMASIKSIGKPIMDAYNAIFGMTAEEAAGLLEKATLAFKSFTESLILNEDAQQKLKAVMEVIFKILSVGVTIIKNIGSILGSILGVIFKLVGLVADFVGTIFSFLNTGRETIDIIDRINTAIDFLGVIIRTVIRKIGQLIDWIGDKLHAFYDVVLKGTGWISDLIKPLIPEIGGIGKAIKESIAQDSLRPFFDAIRNAFPLLDEFVSHIKYFKEVMRIKWETKGIYEYRAVLYKLRKRFEELQNFISSLPRKIKTLRDSVRDALNGVDGALDGIKERFGNFGASIVTAFDNIIKFFGKLKEKFSGFINKLKEGFAGIKEFFSNFTLGGLLGGASTAAFGAYFIYILKMFRDAKKAFKGITENLGKFASGMAELPNKLGDFISKIDTLFDHLGDTLKAFQKKLKAQALLNIALAIGVMAASLWLLSTIPSDKIAAAIGAIAGITILLVAAMKAMTTFTATSGSLSLKGGKLSGSFKPSNITQLALAMVPMAIAILILGRVVYKLGTMPWDAMVRGIGGMAVCLIALMAAMYVLARLVDGRKEGKGILTRATMVERLQKTVMSMVPLAISVWILAQAISTLGKLEIGQLVKGGVAVAAILTVLGLFMKLANKVKIDMKSVASLVIISTTLYILAGAIMIYALIPFDMFVDGIIKVAGAIAAIGGVLYAFPEREVVKSAAAFAIISAALYVLAGAIMVFALIPADLFLIGMLKACAALAALAGVMWIFNKTGAMSIKTAAMLGVLGGSMIALALSMLVFSKVPLAGILKGVLGLAAVLGVLALAAVVLTGSGIIFAIYALCGALALFGLSVALIGGGFALLAWGFTMLGTAGTIGASQAVAALTILLDGITALIPQMSAIFVAGMLAVAQELAAMAPSFAKAFTDFVYAFHDATADLRVKLRELAFDMMTGMADVIIQKAPILGQKLSEASIAIIEGLIPGVQAMGQAMTDLIIAMMTSLKDHIVDVTVAGADLAVALVEGIADGLENAANRMEPAMQKLKNAIIHFFKAMFGIHSPSTVMADEAEHLPEGIAEGITNYIDSEGFGDVMSKLGDSLSEGFTGWMEGGGIRDMVNGFANTFFNGLINATVPGAKETGAKLAENFYTSQTGNQVNITASAQITGAGSAYIKATKDEEESTKLAIEKYGDKFAKWMSDSNIKSLKDRAPMIAAAHKKMQYNAVKEAHGDVVANGLLLASNMTGSIVKGMGNKQGTIGAKAKSIVNSAKASASSVGWTSIGNGIVSGIVSGMSQMLSSVTSYARKLIQKTKKAAQDEADSHSPSRLFRDEVGIWIPEGIAVGIRKRAGVVEDASRAVVRNAAKSASLLADRVSSIVENDMDSSPVITPVVDLTDVIGKSNDISNMLSGAYAYAVSSNIIANRRRAQDAEAMATNVSSGNVVNQYNNMKIIQQPGESMDMFVDRVVGKLETATNMEG